MGKATQKLLFLSKASTNLRRSAITLNGEKTGRSDEQISALKSSIQIL